MSRAVIPSAFASSRKKKPLKDAAMAESLPVNVPSWSRARQIRGGDEERDGVAAATRVLGEAEGEWLSTEEGMGKTQWSYAG
ncbi:hypothetical protein SAY87_010933 [Trapa incisa]|uniref:Uncharacterized protein n=1 Tax=Trapa incisa TaxID=236973 RepID=A0AAN7JB66_9MYRT|nr:hypothetical protein SAY87_010933 [Trapa incisa]